MKYSILIFLVIFIILSLVASRFSQNMFFYLDSLDKSDEDEDEKD